MDALDFTAIRPRSPRVKVAGFVFTARVIDKLRAALPGGNANGYLPFVGFSQLWQHYTGIDLHELFAVVRDAQGESEVEAWIEQRTSALDKEQLNAKMERFDTSRMPAEWRPIFDKLYPEKLRERFPGVFDLLEADDDRVYASTAIVVASGPEEFRSFGEVAMEYEASLPPDLRHADFGRQLQDLAAHYSPPNAAFVATVDETNAGCIAFTRLDERTAVIKKLYVKPAFRGFGIARALMAAVAEMAKERGFTRLALDTDRERLQAAYALYLSLGFKDCAPYGGVEYASPTFMQLEL